MDDSKIYLAFSIRDAELAAMKLTEDMRRITAWCCLNSLLVNPEKTKLLILGTRQMLEQVPENFQITILGENITPVAVAKDLGMILDSCLSYDEHIASVVSSCIAGLGQISRVKHIFDRKTLILIINSLIFSKCITALLSGLIHRKEISRSFKRSRTLLHVLLQEQENTIT